MFLKLYKNITFFYTKLRFKVYTVEKTKLFAFKYEFGNLRLFFEGKWAEIICVPRVSDQVNQALIRGTCHLKYLNVCM